MSKYSPTLCTAVLWAWLHVLITISIVLLGELLSCLHQELLAHLLVVLSPTEKIAISVHLVQLSLRRSS